MKLFYIVHTQNNTSGMDEGIKLPSRKISTGQNQSN